MNPEPQKFFVGLIDFFSVWLPGAILASLGALALDMLPGDDVAGWAAFLVVSYLLGHIVFHFGAMLDVAYDWLRGGTRRGQFDRLADGKPHHPAPARWVAERMFGKGDKPVAVAVRIKEERLSRIRASAAVNAFQWSKARLALDHPEALAIVNRFEADSKFFRSLTIVILVLLAAILLRSTTAAAEGPELVAAFHRENEWLIGGVAAALLLSFWRYLVLRLKSINQAYWFIITLAAEAGETMGGRGARGAAGHTHAGGFVLRRRRGRTEFLLVEARDDPKLFVLPKGHIEDGERPAMTAVREVLEEAGLWASVHDELGTACFRKGGEAVNALIFLMFLTRKPMKLPKAPHRWLPSTTKTEARRVKWLPIDCPSLHARGRGGAWESRVKLPSSDGEPVGVLMTPVETLEMALRAREKLKRR